MAAWLQFANAILNRFTAAEPFKVIEVRIEDHIHHDILAREDSLILHNYNDEKNQTIFEIVLHKENESKIAFSLYRSSNPEESQIYYLRLKDKLPVLVASFPSILTVSTLQELCTHIYNNPSQNLAHICAYFGYVDYFKIPPSEELKEFINAQDDQGRTPLHLAVEQQRVNIIQAVTVLSSCEEIDINFSLCDNKQENVLHYAAHTTSQIIGLLCTAIKNKDPSEMVRLLNTKNSNNITPLYIACAENKPACVKELLKNGADVNGASISAQSNSGSGQQPGDPNNNNQEFLDKLNDKEMKNGGTPLHWCKSAQVIEILVEMNCDLNAKNFHGDTALHNMVAKCDLQCSVSLISLGADVNAIGANGNTPLHVAVKANNISLVQALIVFGADLNLRNSNDDTPRHLAATSQVSPAKDTILYILHSVFALRCPTKRPTCNDGCAPGLSYNGIPPDNVFARNVPLFDRVLLESINQQRVEPNNDHSKVDTNKSKNKKIKVLCMDGGGIRGLILIQILCYLENITGKRSSELFDWVAGTSTGGILALLISCGYPAVECRRIYFKLKDKIFIGYRPYCTDTLESFIKKYLGPEKRLSDLHRPKLLIPATLADRFPPNVQFFRNYPSADQMLQIPFNDNGHVDVNCAEEFLWKVARATGAAPTYFAQFDSYLDGGLIANNPTLDMLTEIQYINRANQILNNLDNVCDIELVVSIGTGNIPQHPLDRLSFAPLFSLSGLANMASNLPKFWSLLKVLVEQASQANGRVVERAQAWCSMIRVPYFRLNPSISEEIQMDESDNVKLINMMWETMAYLCQNSHDLNTLMNFLVDDDGQKPRRLSNPSRISPSSSMET